MSRVSGRASKASRTCPVRFFVCPFIIACSFMTKQCTLPPLWRACITRDHADLSRGPCTRPLSHLSVPELSFNSSPAQHSGVIERHTAIGGWSNPELHHMIPPPAPGCIATRAIEQHASSRSNMSMCERNILQDSGCYNTIKRAYDLSYDRAWFCRWRSVGV